jgi:hypothetical protein
VTDSASLRRRRDLSQIYDESFKVYGSALYTPLLFFLAVPTVALNLFLFWLRQSEPHELNLLLGTPISLVGTALLGTGAVFALDELDRGNIVGFGSAIYAALDKANHLVWSGLKSLVICSLLAITIIGIPWAIARFVSWSFTAPAVMIDQQDGNSALDYSHDLVAGRGWPTFGLMFAVGLPVALINGLFQGATYLVFDGYAAGFVGAVLPIFTFPFATMSHLLIYYDLKMRKAPA